MNKKAFTLIELLAVIVILAIISLIAVPIVMNIISDSKKSSQKQSMELYIKQVESALVKENLKEKFNPSICLIQEDSSLICDSNESNKIDITIKGDKPTKGSILFENGKIIKYKNVKLNNMYYHMDVEGNQTVTTEEIPAICRKEGQVSTELGTKYECDVNDEKTYTFYVLSKEKYNINLIMNSNICNDGSMATSTNKCKTAWYGVNNVKNNVGPVTAMNLLYAGTRNWNNLPNMIMNYTDENNYNGTSGYDGIITDDKITTIIGKNNSVTNIIGTSDKPLKSRMPTLYELNSAGCEEVKYENYSYFGTFSCPTWLVENLAYRNVSSMIGYDKYEINKDNGLDEIGAYWTLSSYGQEQQAMIISSFWGSISAGSVGDYSNVGIRSVISITMDELGTK